jgi:hypothetical protein
MPQRRSPSLWSRRGLPLLRHREVFYHYDTQSSLEWQLKKSCTALMRTSPAAADVRRVPRATLISTWPEPQLDGRFRLFNVHIHWSHEPHKKSAKFLIAQPFNVSMHL